MFVVMIRSLRRVRVWSSARYSCARRCGLCELLACDRLHVFMLCDERRCIDLRSSGALDRRGVHSRENAVLGGIVAAAGPLHGDDEDENAKFEERVERDIARAAEIDARADESEFCPLVVRRVK